MKIFVKDLTFDTILGVLDKERIYPQTIIVNAKINYDYSNGDFVDYSLVVKLIKTTMQERKFYLIEDALEEMITLLKKEFPKIYKIKLKIAKVDILKECIVGANIKRKLKEN